MRISRLFKIVYLLLGKEKLTAQELAEYFEVSTRTIHRDIDALMQAGIPIYAQRGSRGGFSLMEGFVLDKTLLTDEEQAQVLLGLQGFPSPGKTDTDIVLEKLSILFNKPQPDWIEIDFSRWGYKEKDNTRFEVLKKSIIVGHSIIINYIDSSGATSKRELYPLKLVYKSRAWYLQAYCLSKNDYRTFKINRIINIEPVQSFFDRKNYIVPLLEIEGERSYKYVSLELTFTSHVAARVYDEFDVDAIEVSEEGGLHVYTDYPDTEYLYSLLASFGENVEVIGPERVRKKVMAKHNSL